MRVGLSLEDATDITILTAELKKVDRQLHDLTVSAQMRYAPRQHRDELVAELLVHMTQKDQIQVDVEVLRHHEALLRVAVEAARAYLEVQLPHQTVGDAVVMALSTAVFQNNDTLTGMS